MVRFLLVVDGLRVVLLHGYFWGQSCHGYSLSLSIAVVAVGIIVVGLYSFKTCATVVCGRQIVLGACLRLPVPVCPEGPGPGSPT